MESTKQLKSKKTMKILAIILLLTVPATQGFADESPYWVAYSQPVSNLDELGNAIGTLSPDKQAKALVCMMDSQYTVVHSEPAKDQASAETAKAQLNGATILQVPADHCFHPSNFLTFPPPPKVTANQEAVEPTPPATRINLSKKVDKRQQIYTKRAYKAEELGNTTVSVLPEVVTKIELSSRDINRFTCGSGRPVKDIVIPDEEEKGVRVERHGSDVFVDYVVFENEAGERKYAEGAAEFYIMCGEEGTVYTVIGIPNDELPAQTVQLVNNGVKIKKNKSLFAGMAFEQKIVAIIQDAYKSELEEIPSYAIKRMNRKIDALERVGIQVTLQFVARIEGEGLQVKQYELRLKPDFAGEKIKVQEKYFLLPQLAENPVAIALDSQLQISKDRGTRLFIIEQTDLGNS